MLMPTRRTALRGHVCMAMLIGLYLFSIAIVAVGSTAAEKLVADTLGIAVEEVQVVRIRPGDVGRYREIRARVRRKAPETIDIAYGEDGEQLRRILWVDRCAGPAEGDHISMAQAKSAAQELVERFFPEVPVKLTLQQVRERKGMAARYLFTFEGRVQGHVFTGDGALVLICGWGKPKMYAQDVARKRPGVDVVRVDRKQALLLLMQRLGRDYEQPITCDVVEAKLILSSSTAADNGPVWQILVNIEERPTGELLDRRSLVIDAVSGKVLEQPQ